MNCFNCARYLAKALESVRAQTYTDWEIVFWDNCSTDNSAAIFKSYKDTRFHYFLAGEHTILAPAKNFAVDRAVGEWLAFLDCDDLWEPDKLQQQVAIISAEETSLGLVYGRMGVLIEKEAKTTSLALALGDNNFRDNGKSLPEGYIFTQLLKQNFIPQPSAMVRRSAYLGLGGVNPSFKRCWDYDLWLKICRSFKARAIQEVCCHYRVHTGNLSHHQSEDDISEVLTILDRYASEPGVKWSISQLEICYASFLFKQGRWIAAFRQALRVRNVPALVLRTVMFIGRRLKLIS